MNNWRVIFFSLLNCCFSNSWPIWIPVAFYWLICKLLLKFTFQPCWTTFSSPTFFRDSLFPQSGKISPTRHSNWLYPTKSSVFEDTFLCWKSPQIPRRLREANLMCPVIISPYGNYLFTYLPSPLDLKLFEAGKIFVYCFIPRIEKMAWPIADAQ